MAQDVVLSTTIAIEVKRAATAYCKRKGLKLRYLIERALIEQLEDEIDLQAYLDRRDEASIPLADLLVTTGINKPSRR